jgi:hypothetical protein
MPRRVGWMKVSAMDPAVRTFTCLMKDHRYSVPTLSFLVTRDVEQARELAQRELNANPNHLGFELHEDVSLGLSEGG